MTTITKMKAKEFVKVVARMQPYPLRDGDSGFGAEDTLNELIYSARKMVKDRVEEPLSPPPAAKKYYTVHLYRGMRTKVTGVEASSQEGAVERAREAMGHDWSYAMESGDAEDDGTNLGALVDEEGDVDYAKTWYHKGPDAGAY